MQPIVLGTQATPIADTLQQTITIAVMTGKGGVGKTWLAQLLAIFAVAHGITTKLIDLDGQPTLTAQFGHYTNGHLMRQLQIDPIRLTVQGLMLHPENGEEAMRLEYPLADVLINKLPVRPRMPVSRVNERTIVARTLDTYGIDVERVAPLTVIPNSGTFEPFIFAVAEAKARDRLLQERHLLRRALEMQEQRRSRAGLPIQRLVILDVGGERSLVSANAIAAATHILPIFNMGAASIEGLMGMAEDVREARAKSADASRAARFLPAVANMFDGDQEEECAAWIEQTVKPRLATTGISVVPRDYYIPFTRECLRADRKQVMPFEYNPLDRAIQHVDTLLRYLLSVAAGRAA